LAAVAIFRARITLGAQMAVPQVLGAVFFPEDGGG